MIVKLAVTAIIFAVVIIYLRGINTELAMLATVCASVVLVIFAIDLLSQVFSVYERLAAMTSLSEGSLKILIKVTVISYIVEFSAGIIEDFGMKSLADKLVFAGKIIILLLAVPVLEAMLNIIEGLL